jgi:hypothetical protein
MLVPFNLLAPTPWIQRSRVRITLPAAKEDPTGLRRNLDRAVINEAQRVPHLLLSLKKTIDEDRRPDASFLPVRQT